MTEKKVVKNTKPELVEVNGRQVISTNRWNNEKIAEYILICGQKWIPVADLAKCAWRHSDKATKKRARKNLHIIYQLLLKHNQVLVYEYEDRHIERVKLFDGSSVSERQSAEQKAQMLRNRLQLSADQYEQVLKLIGGGTAETKTKITDAIGAGP